MTRRANIVAIVAAAWLGLNHPSCATSTHLHVRRRTQPDQPCHTITNVTYVPSAWEADWMQRVDAATQPCAEMQQHPDRVAVWLDGVASPAAAHASNATVFSRFEKTCVSSTGQRTIVSDAIEPLVGHMRHPLGLKACALPGQTPVDVQSRTYISLLDNSDGKLSRMYPGRNILVDAGTGTFDTSLHWFVRAYGDKGIQFDAIYAWEATPLEATRYWAAVPDDVKPVLHFYNAPVSTDPASSMNPVTMIKRIAQPGDFVVFKLDVDNDAVESAIMTQLEGDDVAIARITEMFFEKHYFSPDMMEFFGAPPVTLAEATHNFARLRAKGLRLHYWP